MNISMLLNVTHNQTHWLNEFLHKYQHTFDFFFGRIYLLALVLIGCVGNVFVIITFGRKAFRTTARCNGSNSSVYPFLFYMAISDTLYLMILFCLWLSNYVNILHRQGICQITLYLTYVCNFVNAYYTLAYTAQRLCAVIRPFRVAQFLSWYRSRFLALSIIGFACVLYSYLPFLIGIVSGRCFSKPEYRWINQYMDVVDCIVVFLVPYLLIITMNSIIVISLRRLKENNGEFFSTTHSQINQVRELTRRNASRQMTKLLLAVSTAYLIICAPYACVHSWRLLMMNENDHNMQSLMRKVETYLHYIYHASFAMNFYIYILYNSKFRRELKRLFNKSSQNFDRSFLERQRIRSLRLRPRLEAKPSSMLSIDGNSQKESREPIFVQNYCCCQSQTILN